MKKLWLAVFFLVFIWSAIYPKDYFTWFLEVLPAVAGFVAVAVTYKRFQLTRLAYVLILIHCIILMVGGHYTYAEVPLFDWIRDYFSFDRNNYDKVGHFAQGFIPAIITREILIRHYIVRTKGWLNFIIISICLAVSAFYELLEWWVALMSGESADSFLGTQGYVWDTQSDMFLAFSGAILALVLLSRLHDSQLKKFTKEGIGENRKNGSRKRLN